MSNFKSLAAIVACTAVGAFSPAAHAATELIVNGGFESPVNAFAGSFTTYTSGLDGWVINDGSVDLINSYWAPAAGSYSLDLNGSGAGSISQSFATQIGKTYNVSFSMAGNPDNGGGNIKTISANVTTPNVFSFDIVGKSAANMGWVTQTFTFVAAGNSSTLTFVGAPANTFYGAALDQVSVMEAVPEPETYAMLLAGLGMVGYLARRRKNTV
jgi:choice-of-anchor C domain-containing protein